MSKRLASFNGPSTPNSSPVVAGKALRSPFSPSTSNNAPGECVVHRKVRALLGEIRAAAKAWEGLVTVDGVKAAKSLIDARTELGNAIALLPPGSQPRTRTVGPKLATMDKNINYLEDVLSKLDRQFTKMARAIAGLETLLFQTIKSKGWDWAHEEPLWCTWSLEKFASSVPSLLPPYRRALEEYKTLVNELRDHSVPFERSRAIISEWTTQSVLGEGGWSEWEDLFSVEVDRWNISKTMPTYDQF